MIEHYKKRAQPERFDLRSALKRYPHVKFKLLAVPAKNVNTVGCDILYIMNYKF